MTRLEKAKELRPDMAEEDICRKRCPSDLYPVILDKPITRCEGRLCSECWNEPYEEGETK